MIKFFRALITALTLIIFSSNFVMALSVYEYPEEDYGYMSEIFTEGYNYRTRISAELDGIGESAPVKWEVKPCLSGDEWLKFRTDENDSRTLILEGVIPDFVQSNDHSYKIIAHVSGDIENPEPDNGNDENYEDFIKGDISSKELTLKISSQPDKKSMRNFERFAFISPDKGTDINTLTNDYSVYISMTEYTQLEWDKDINSPVATDQYYVAAFETDEGYMSLPSWLSFEITETDKNSNPVQLRIFTKYLPKEDCVGTVRIPLYNIDAWYEEDYGADISAGWTVNYKAPVTESKSEEIKVEEDIKEVEAEVENEIPVEAIKISKYEISIPSVKSDEYYGIVKIINDKIPVSFKTFPEVPSKFNLSVLSADEIGSYGGKNNIAIVINPDESESYEGKFVFYDESGGSDDVKVKFEKNMKTLNHFYFINTYAGDKEHSMTLKIYGNYGDVSWNIEGSKLPSGINAEIEETESPSAKLTVKVDDDFKEKGKYLFKVSAEDESRREVEFEIMVNVEPSPIIKFENDSYDLSLNVSESKEVKINFDTVIPEDWEVDSDEVADEIDFDVEWEIMPDEKSKGILTITLTPKSTMTEYDLEDQDTFNASIIITDINGNKVPIKFKVKLTI